MICRYLLVYLSTKNFIKLIFKINNIRLGFRSYRLDFDNPRTFNEKVIYLKLNYRLSLIPLTTDKINVRKYVADKIGEHYLIPILNSYNSVNEIDFFDLPNKFALKTTHGCGGWNLICDNKDNINWSSEKKKLEGFLKMNPFFIGREWQYNFVPRLICEELIGYNLIDYKFFCNFGIVKAIQVDSGRFTNHQRIILNPKWEKLNIQIRYKNFKNNIEKPKRLMEMIQIAEKLSFPFIFCRVDLFYHNEKIYFGEITHTPGGGTEPFTNYSQDLNFGKLFSL